MNKKFFVYLVVCLLLLRDQHIEAHAQYKKSMAMRVINKSAACIRHLYFLNPSSCKDADPFYQELAKEAQTALGIAPKDQLPVKRIENIGIFSQFGAIAEPDFIYINEDRIKDRPYGYKRFALFHEVMHVKYDDVAKYEIIDASLLPLYFFTYFSMKQWGPAPVKKFMEDHVSGWKWHVVLPFAIEVLFSYLYNLPGCERRADVEGAYACACYQCVHEAASTRLSTDDKTFDAIFQRKRGYLSKEELQAIADDLKEKNCCCSYHLAISRASSEGT